MRNITRYVAYDCFGNTREREREREREKERERNWESITNKYLERDATSLVFHFGRKNVLAGIFAV